MAEHDDTEMTAAAELEAEAAEELRAEQEARLRAKVEEIRQQREARAAEARRLERIEQLKVELPTRFDLASIKRARAKMEKAMEEYVVACKSYNEQLTEVRAEVQGLAPTPDDLRVEGVTLQAGGKSYRLVDSQDGIGSTGRAVVGRHERGRISFDGPRPW